jgi:hypothetical protein
MTRTDWRCCECGKLLGIVTTQRLHIRFLRGKEALCGYPVTIPCWGCGTLNEIGDRDASALHSQSS